MKENKKLILSICIPTWNRRYSLQYTLKSIMDQDEFKSGEVEIVISDNASTDETEVEVGKLCKKYKNIRYFRNKENIGGNPNIIKVMGLGKGEYLRCLSSHVILLSGSLKNIMTILYNCYCDILIMAGVIFGYKILKTIYYNPILGISKFSNKNDFFQYVGQQIKYDKSSFRDFTDCFSNMSYEIVNAHYYRSQFEKVTEEKGEYFINNYNFTHWFIVYYKSEKECSIVLNYKKAFKGFSELKNEKIDLNKERKTGWFRGNPIYFKDACYFVKYLSKEYKLDEGFKEFLKKHKLFWFRLFISGVIFGLVPGILKDIFPSKLKKYIADKVFRL